MAEKLTHRDLIMKFALQEMPTGMLQAEIDARQVSPPILWMSRLMLFASPEQVTQVNEIFVEMEKPEYLEALFAEMPEGIRTEFQSILTEVEER